MGFALILDGVFNHCRARLLGFPSTCNRRVLPPLTAAGSTVCASASSNPLWRPLHLHPLGRSLRPGAHLNLTQSGRARAPVSRLYAPGCRNSTSTVCVWMWPTCWIWNFLRELSAFCRALKPDFFLLGEVVHGDYSRWANPQTLDSATNYEGLQGPVFQPGGQELL